MKERTALKESQDRTHCTHPVFMSTLCSFRSGKNCFGWKLRFDTDMCAMLTHVFFNDDCNITTSSSHQSGVDVEKKFKDEDSK